MKFAISALLGLALAAGTATGALAQTEIQWWHAMAGANNEVVDALAKEFNESQSDYKVVPVFKGTYPEALNAGIAAFRAGQPPHILQVFDVGTGVMMNAEGAIKPVAEVLEMGGQTFDKSQYLPGIVAYYSRPDGTMLSFPYNSSSPITYYNKDIYEKAGLDPNDPPETWEEVWEHARKIHRNRRRALRLHLRLAHLDPSGELRRLEQPPIRDAGERPRRARYRAEDQLADLRQAHAGHRRPRRGRRVQIWRPHVRGEGLLHSPANAASTTISSGGLGDIVKSGINYGTGPLPYEPTAEGAPQNTIPGGASLWVFAGHPDEDYKGVAAFFNFLSQTEIQSRLHQVSGYLPVTHGRLRCDQGSRLLREESRAASSRSCR